MNLVDPLFPGISEVQRLNRLYEEDRRLYRLHNPHRSKEEIDAVQLSYKVKSGMEILG